MTISTAALISRDSAFLFVRRPAGGDLSQCWELPGGKTDPGETPEDALRRELDEELGISARIGDLAATSRFSHGGQEFELRAYHVSSDLSGMELREHSEACWRVLSRATELDLAPSDRSLIEKLMGGVTLNDGPRSRFHREP